MKLIKFAGFCGYGVTAEDDVILNPEEISSVERLHAGRCAHSQIRMKNGDKYTVQGTPSEIMNKLGD